MKRWFKYWFLLVFAIAGCEEIYTPDIEARESVIVADARIVAGKTDNIIRIYESRGYNDESYSYSNIPGAQVSITDNAGKEITLYETRDGIFPVHFSLNPKLQFKLRIIYGGNTFESSFEPVPQIPDVDTVYGIKETKFIKQSGNNDADDIRETVGVQLYTNITNEKVSPFYRFTARKVLQYTYPVEIVVFGEVLVETMYGWLSTIPKESFNIAAPAEYSATTDIVKHPLYFMEQRVNLGIGDSFAGWILILHQYGLSESGYNYYNDLNKQLVSEGRLFDPLYVQARNNLKCTNNPKQLILGNFEISAYKEHRYFVNYISDKHGFLVKRIPYFYEIPAFGEQLSTPPEFWEYSTKPYPDEE